MTPLPDDPVERALEEFSRACAALHVESDPARLGGLACEFALTRSGARGAALLGADASVLARAGAPEASLSIVREVLARGEPVLVGEAARDRAHAGRASVSGLGLRSILCVPVFRGRLVLGALYIDDSTRGGAFDRRTLRDLQRVAEQVSVAWGRAGPSAPTEPAPRAPRDAPPPGVPAFAGRGEAIRKVQELLDRVAATDLPVLLSGESGVGKERAARVIHASGARRAGPFVVVPCGAIAEGLLAGALFGHVKGAFTGAQDDRAGLFEAAAGGTVLLDEIGDMDPRMQSSVLRVLQDGEMRRVGEAEARRVDVRLMATTRRDLAGEVRAGRFREDLYYRLNVVRIDLPPLRERIEDLPLLVLDILAEGGDPGVAGDVAPAALERLAAYPWPGNVRELRNELHRAALLSPAGIRAEDLSPSVREYRPEGSLLEDLRGQTLRGAVEQLERVLILEALDAAAGNKTGAARRLGLSWPGLQKKMRRYGLL